MIPLLAAAAEKIPDLRPPLGEIPPSLWERHGTQFVVGSTLGAVAVVVLALWLMRKKPPVVIPPAVTARQALEILRGRTETLALAAEVSRVIRHYVLAKLDQAGEEPTTEELVRRLTTDIRFSPGNVQSLGSVLRDCDAQKFAPTIAPQPDLVTRAFEIVEKFEVDTKPPPAPTAA